jgi:D-alanine-D-alanine ligase
MSTKKKIAFVTGGYSGEAQISYKSAIQIESNLDTAIYDVYKIDIRKDGWFYQPKNGSEVAINKADFTIDYNNEHIHFDAVLIGIHGTPGEDGKLQGYLDLVGLPYTSCDAATSAITFNKRYTTAVAGTSGINVARSMLFFSTDDATTLQKAASLTFPLFVKPNNGGSSIGMSKIKDATELIPAFEKAFKEDTQVLVEEFISGREFTIGVYRSHGKIVILPITEVISENYFFDFEAKYQGKSKETTPAEIDEDMNRKLCTAAKKIFTIFNCSGVVRIDFIYNETKQEPYMLEINTVPGQSEMSVVPQQVRASGGNLKDFYSELIEQALATKK